MTDEVSTSRSVRNRRMMAILAWSGLTLAAATLWICRRQGMIRGYTTEPIALMLSAYGGFVSIFAWMLFSPGRRALKESPALFFSAAVTLLPPCIIAFHLMPPESPFRGWLTVGLFLFGAIAVLSPVPEEFFAIPRERRSYLRPVTGALFEGLQYENNSLELSRLQPVPVPRPTPAPPKHRSEDRAIDPWRDPFAGTGTAPRRIRRPQESPPAEARHRRETPDSVAGGGTAFVAGEAAVQTPPPPRPASPPPRVQPTHGRPAGDRQEFESRRDGVTLRGDASTAATAAALPAASPATSPRVTDDDRRAGESAGDQDRDTAGDELTFDRMQDEFGGELVEGTIRVRFEPGQKRAHLHVPFQPPLPGVPDVECEAVGAEALRVKVPVRQTYGIRIDARRSDAAAALETEVGFSAIYTPPDRRI